MTGGCGGFVGGLGFFGVGFLWCSKELLDFFEGFSRCSLDFPRCSIGFPGSFCELLVILGHRRWALGRAYQAGGDRSGCWQSSREP